MGVSFSSQSVQHEYTSSLTLPFFTLSEEAGKNLFLSGLASSLGNSSLPKSSSEVARPDQYTMKKTVKQLDFTDIHKILLEFCSNFAR